MNFDYYTPPSDEVFNEIKRACIELWRTYDDTYGYASGKVARIENIQNIQDNAWYMIAMFDKHNQAKLVSYHLKNPARQEVERMLDWSNSQV